MRRMAPVLLLALTGSVNAALIDNGIYTTDTASGLDWLALSETTLCSYNSAEACYAGWRHATNAEIEDLFGQSFSGYFDTDTYNTSSGSSRYAQQDADAVTFISLFGGSNQQRAIGMYADEDGIGRFMGTQYLFDIGDPTIVYGLEFTNVYDLSSGYGSGIGQWMVRTTTVPIPAAAWLFGSALAGLGWIKSKKAS